MVAPIQNFVDLSGPVIGAAWLNRVDLATVGMIGTAAGNLTLGPPTSGTALTLVNLLGNDALDINLNQQPGVGWAINISGGSTGDIRGIEVTNTTTGATSGTVGLVVNNNTTRALLVGVTSSGWVGSKFTNSPAGNISFIWSGNDQPLSIAVGVSPGVQAIGVSGPNGNVTIGPALGGVSLTVAASAAANLALAVTGNPNLPVAQQIVNSNTVGNQACSILDVGDGTNFGALLFQNAGFTTPLPVNGVAGLSFNIGTNGNIPLTFNTNGTVRWALSGTGAMVVFAPTSGTALTVNGFAGVAATVNITAPNSAGNSFGLNINGGTTAADWAISIQNGALNQNLMKIRGDGSGFLGPTTGNTLSWNAAGAYSIAAPSSGQTLTLNGANSSFTLFLQAGTGAGTSFGMTCSAGTTAADNNFVCHDATGVTLYFRIFGDGGIIVGNPTGGDKGLGALNAVSLFASNLPVFGSTVVTKTAGTSRASTTVMANDPDFTFAIPGAGTYKVEVLAGMHQAAAGTIGGIVNLNFSGTLSTTNKVNAVLGVLGQGVTSVASTVQAAISPQFIGTTQFDTFLGDLLMIEAVFSCTTAGTVAVSWAQQTSSASATTMDPGTMTITRLA